MVEKEGAVLEVVVLLARLEVDGVEGCVLGVLGILLLRPRVGYRKGTLTIQVDEYMSVPRSLDTGVVENEGSTKWLLEGTFGGGKLLAKAKPVGSWKRFMEANVCHK